MSEEEKQKFIGQVVPEGDEDTIEEEIEGAADATISPLHSN